MALDPDPFARLLPPGSTDVRDFYRTRRWKTVRKQVLEAYHHECQSCKARGRLTLATLVHHEKPLRDYPEYALTPKLPDGSPQLIPLCDPCHERIETERGNRSRPTEVLTPEWW